MRELFWILIHFHLFHLIIQIDKDGENNVSVQDILLELRKYRMGLIQTFDQLTFSYEAIIEGMRRMNNDVSIACSVTLSDIHFSPTHL